MVGAACTLNHSLPTYVHAIPCSLAPLCTHHHHHHNTTLNRGHGTALVDGRLTATVCGVVQRINKLIYVQPVKSRWVKNSTGNAFMCVCVYYRVPGQPG